MSRLITLKQTHIRIEQGLQSVGIFAYSDSLHQEIDLAIEASITKLIDAILDDKKREGGFQGKQISLDDLRLIQEKDAEFATIKGADNTYTFGLPQNYNHLIKLSALVSRTCNGTKNTKKAVCRLTASNTIDNIKSSHLGKTSPNSPLAEMSNETIYGYADSSFAIDKFYMTYIITPNRLSYTSAPTAGLITSGDNMQFPFETMIKIIDETVLDLSVKLQQPQQKIVNLSQTKLT
jgi:hypothetical protein